MKVFSIDGYFKDDNSEFNNYLVSESDDTPNGYVDEDIFYYGVSEDQLKNSISGKEMFADFTVTSYREVK